MASNEQQDLLEKLAVKRTSVADSTRLEYKRLLEERAINRRMASAACFVHAEQETAAPLKKSLFNITNTMDGQTSEPEVTSFPFADSDSCSDNNGTDNPNKALESPDNHRKRHGARLCMISAIIHMKYIAQRRAKANVEIAKNPETSLEERENLTKTNEVSYEETEVDDWRYLRKCRYLRGVAEDKELTIKQIFS